MAQTTLYPINVYYATGGSSTWNNGTLFAGVSGSSNYRSKIHLRIGDYLTKSEKLVVSVKIYTQSSPSATYAVLTKNGDIPIGKVVSDTYVSSQTNGPHPDLLAEAIAESYPYNDAEGTSVHTGSNKQNGFTYYYVFNTDQLEPNTDYFIYVMRNTYTGCGSTSGYTGAYMKDISISLTYAGSPLYQSNCVINGQKGRGGTTYGNAAAYMGYGNGTTHYESVLSFTTGEFTGTSKYITFQIKMSHSSLTTARTYRWALLSSDANALGNSTTTNYYYNTASEVADDNQLAQGTIEWICLNLDTHKTLRIETNALEPNTTYYLVLWPSTTSPTSFLTISAAQYHGMVFVDYVKELQATIYHYLLDTMETFDTTIESVEYGAAYTPNTITPPDGYTSNGATFNLYDYSWNNIGTGVCGFDYLNIYDNVIIEIYYPLGGGFVYYNNYGTAVKCEVYFNDNGTARKCEVYYNNNGVAVKV